jgi:hypothetical protein
MRNKFRSMFRVLASQNAKRIAISNEPEVVAVGPGVSGDIHPIPRNSLIERILVDEGRRQ